MREKKKSETYVKNLLGMLCCRDAETEEHTQRVTALTTHFARLWGLSKEQLIYVRHGAQLHDIGKVGIPDAILHKNGPLTDDEWAVMRMHPIYACELLHPVSFLRPALDIPYCHHEKWDGSGYPQGLKGNQIPFAARLFAIVDVWDALLSDRPYRPAWTREKTIAYLHDQSGKHFEPAMLIRFDELLRSMGECTRMIPSFSRDPLPSLRQELSSTLLTGSDD